MNRKRFKAVVALSILISAYFVVFPDDLDVLVPVARVLELSKAISPWLYVLIAVVVVARAIERVWGRRPAAP